MLNIKRFPHLAASRYSAQMSCPSLGARNWLCISSAILLMLATCLQHTQAVPTDRRNLNGDIYLHLPLLHRVMRDVNEQKDSISAESMIEQPQGQCLLDGLLVEEKTVYCEKQVGCRAIQKTGHCCPDYKCDCQKDGRTYSNGDKLVDPENPCTVCYCQGGEILCSSVTCFQRDDCTPKYIPGRCCPEYNDCPVISPESIHNRTVYVSSTAKPEHPHPLPHYLNITIKEITKPTEIRITDDNKATAIQQMLKTSTTTTTTTSSTTTTSTTTTTASPSTPPAIATTISPLASPAVAAVPLSASTTEQPQVIASITPEDAKQSNVPTATQSHISNESESKSKESKEMESLMPIAPMLVPSGPVSSTLVNENNNNPAVRLSNDNNQQVQPPSSPPPRVTNANESLKLTASVAYSTNERLPAVNGHGFIPAEELNGNGQTNQQGLPLYAANGFSSEVDSSKVNIKRENFSPNEGIYSVVNTSNAEDFDSSDVLISEGSDFVQQTASALDSDAAGSDVFNTYLTTDGVKTEPGSSTDAYIGIRLPTATEGIFPKEDVNAVSDSVGLQQTHFSTEGPDFPIASTSSHSANHHEELLQVSTEGVNQLATSSSSPSTADDSLMLKSTTDLGVKMEEDDAQIPIESNPAYPSLPEDDFSIRFPLNENEDVAEVDIKDEPRSINNEPVQRIHTTNAHHQKTTDNNNSNNNIAHPESPSKTTKLLDETPFDNVDGSGSGSGILNLSLDSGNYNPNTSMDLEGSSTPSPIIDLNSMTTEGVVEMLKAKAELMYSAEDSSAETAILNSTDFKVSKIQKEIHNETEDSEETLESDTLDTLLMMGSGSGSGSGNGSDESLANDKEKKREPTTPRPTKRALADIDIDDINYNVEGSALAPAEDPKLEVESLKIDENENSNDSGGNPNESSARANILAIHSKPTQNRAFNAEPPTADADLIHMLVSMMN